MLRAFNDKDDPKFWTEASQGKLTEEKWREFIKSNKLSASVDYPMSLYWRDLAKMYPNAKVLLSVRDPVKWYHSVNNTILQIVKFVRDSWLALPVRLISAPLKYKPFIAPQFTCFAPTYLGAKYPKGMFGAVMDGNRFRF